MGAGVERRGAVAGAITSADVTGSRRMLLVHAHPDDESITTGATIAAAVEAGVAVTLLTCTRGEEGEVLLPELTDLRADRLDALADHRVGELRAALAALGVRDHRFLEVADVPCEPGRPDPSGPERPEPAQRRHRSDPPFAGFRDSGMLGTVSTGRQDCLARADPLVTASAVAAVVREVRPQVVLTYDERGGYGHPDHVAAHRATMYGCQLAAAPFRPDLGSRWSVPKIYWSAAPQAVTLRGLAEAGAGLPSGQVSNPVQAADPSNWRVADPATVLVTADALITTRIDARAQLPAKRAALRAHASQLRVDGDRFALTNGVAQPVSGVEYYRLAQGRCVPGPDGLEADLFAGLDGAQPA